MRSGGAALDERARTYQGQSIVLLLLSGKKPAEANSRHVCDDS